MTETLVRILQAIVTAAQLVALLVMYKLAIKQYRMGKSSSYLERFLERDLFECRETVDEWLENGMPDEKKLAWINHPDNRDHKQLVIVYANFFSRTGYCIQQRLSRQGVRQRFVFILAAALLGQDELLGCCVQK